MTRKTPYNSRFAKAGVSCFYESEVLNSNFVHLMKFSAENPRLRKAAKRCTQLKKLKHEKNKYGNRFIIYESWVICSRKVYERHK
jgi:hypothetical protein